VTIRKAPARQRGDCGTRPASRQKTDMALLYELAGEADPDDSQFPDTVFSNNIWHFDTECINDHGDYAVIARRMAALTQGALAISGIQDHVDVENGIAWLSFRLDDELIRWDLVVDDDWVDSQVFDRFAALLAHTGSPRRYRCFDLQGQDLLIGCATPEEKEKLERETNLEVEWFSPI
jgi:hypothetical protein